MEKKILIIAKNNLNISFWSQHLDTTNVTIEIVHINDFKHSSEIQNTSLVIMDNYFDNQDSETWMRYQAHSLRSKGYNNGIIFLSPHYADDQQFKIVELSKVSKYTFSQEFINEVNTTIINLNQHQPTAKQM